MVSASLPHSLARKARTYLKRLCEDISSRRVGSEGNRAATDFFADVVASFGFEIESQEFRCIDWRAEAVALSVDGTSFEAFASPYSLGCHASAPLVVVSTVAELESRELADRIVLLRGDIAREPLMPKNFPFYNPDEHRHIIHLLETKRPLAIVAAPSPNPGMIGAVYPHPLFEDGDFDVPSVYMAAEEGERLVACEGRETRLESRATRTPATGRNVIGRRGADRNRRAVLFAHIDARMGTPGASDNASGVVVLLLLAELLAGYTGKLGIELVAMNGEDYYSNPGEQLYLSMNAGSFGGIVLGVNVDGVGYREGNVAYSLYNCPSELAQGIQGLFSRYEGLVEGEQWYQGDHGLFLVNERPTLALTSDRALELLAEIIHSPRDVPEILDTGKLVTTAYALRDLLLHLDRHLAA